MFPTTTRAQTIGVKSRRKPGKSLDYDYGVGGLSPRTLADLGVLAVSLADFANTKFSFYFLLLAVFETIWDDSYEILYRNPLAGIQSPTYDNCEPPLQTPREDVWTFPEPQ